MAQAVDPRPQGYHSVTPYLTIDNAAAAIEFYGKALGAKEIARMPAPGGKIGHAELQIGDSRIMLSDEFPQMGGKSAKTLGGTPVALHVYVENVDEVAARAISAGMKVRSPVKTEFYGDRVGSFEDPFGFKWFISTHVEEVSPEEMDRRAKEAFAGMQESAL
jgi:PhnB protein